MEALTQSERDVLYEARDFARFRKVFYFDVVSGDGGYLSLLLQLQAIRNLEANLSSMEQNLQAHEALAKAGIVSPLQVDQVFQSYQSGRLRLIRARNNLESALDAYKFRLGLPPELKVQLDDSLLTPFQLNSPAVEDLGRSAENLLVAFRELDEAPPVEQVRVGFASLQLLHHRLLEQITEVQKELERWKSQPDDPADEDGLGRERETQAQETLTQRITELAKNAEESGQQFASAAEAVTDQAIEQAWESIRRLTRQESSHASDLFVMQTQIRAYLIELKPAEFEEDEAIGEALSNRLDLMNRRAEVVDSWRGIRVAADRLQSDLDFFVDADIATDPDTANPLKFSAEASRYRVGVRLDGPLNRKAERNAYRAQLIDYQRARRQFIASRDEIVRAVRRNLRELTADRLNFEISRQSLITAARQVELARIQLLAPGQSGDSSTTQDALNALNSLLEAKNALISVWVTYETDRLLLLLNTEALQLNERGLETTDEQDHQEGAEPEVLDPPSPVGDEELPTPQPDSTLEMTTPTES